MQANNAKAVSACTEAIRAFVKPQAIKPKMPKGLQSQLSGFHPSPQAWEAEANSKLHGQGK
jgi:large subunit ribosomal protein L29e